MMKYLMSVSIILMVLTNSFAQPQSNIDKARTGIISGIVKDSQSENVVEYASVMAFSSDNKKMLGGTITDEFGKFVINNLPFGKYFIEVKFIGYTKLRQSNISLNQKNSQIFIGVLKLKLSAEELDEVNVVADRTQIQYKLDKKVINVGQDVTSTGGSAVDVLEKSPSVQTDIDGNVTLRGSSSFTVFIDGKPSVLTGSDALQQIPASEIKSIEIMTNPSAKYDPDGVAGIINVVMNKNKLSGVSGVVNLTAGLNNKYKGDFLLNYRSKKINWFVSGNYRDYDFLGNLQLERETYLPTDTSYLIAGGDRNMNRSGYSVKTGFDWNISDAQSLTFSAAYGGFEFGRLANSNYDNYTSSNPTHQYYNALDNFSVKGPYYSGDLSYRYDFKKKGHNLQAQVVYSNRDRDEGTDFEQYDIDADGNRLDNVPTAYNNNTISHENNLRVKLDYSLPLGKDRKFEAGYQSRFSHSDYNYTYQNLTNGAWVEDSTQANLAEFDRNIHSLYATYSDKILGFGVQAGLRGEYTDRDFHSLSTGDEAIVKRPDFFPSMHISRDLGSGFEMQAGYSRRIRRPRDRHLDPFHAHSDQFSVRTGNPYLEPEYTDSYELNFIKNLGFSSLSLETYYRYGTNKMTRVQSLMSDGRILMTMDNLNNDKAFGAELAANMVLSKSIMIMASTNFYNYKLEGNVDGQDEVAESNNLDARLNATFKLRTNTRFQVNAFYMGPSASIQGTREAFIFTNAAVKQSFLKNKLNLTLSVRDPFGTMHHKFTSTSDNFYSYVDFNREAHVVEFSVNYRINNYKAKRGKRGSNGSDMNDISDEM